MWVGGRPGAGLQTPGVLIRRIRGRDVGSNLLFPALLCAQVTWASNGDN